MERFAAVGFWFFWIFKVGFTYLFFESSPAYGAVLNGLLAGFSLLVFGLICIKKGRFRHLRGGYPTLLLALYLTWVGASTIWTQASSTSVAVAYWVVGLLELASLWLLSSLLEPVDRWRCALWGTSLGALVLGAVVLLTAQRMGDGRLGDFLLHPNTLGRQYAIAAMFAVLALQSNLRLIRRPILAMIALALISLVLLSLSKTNIIALAMAIMVSLAFGRRLKRFAFLLVLMSLPVLAVWPAVSEYLDTYEKSSGEAGETLSGRTLLWAEVWEMIQQKPVIGFGHMSFRDVGPDIFMVGMSHAHNEFLHQWFSYGIVGVILSVLVYLSVPLRILRLKSLAKQSGDEVLAFQWKLGVAFCVFFLVRGLTEAGSELVFLPILMLAVMLIDRAPGRQSVINDHS